MPASLALPAAPSAAALPAAPEEVAARLRRLLPGWEVRWTAATGSTNADAQQALRAGAAGPLLIGSHVQTAGRGRAGRTWHTQPGQALLFSCGWRAAIPPARLPPLSLVAGLAACEALAGALGDAPGDDRLALKWPNDLLWGQAKLAGILVETVAAAAGAGAGAPAWPGIVAGIGINLHGAEALGQALGREVADWSMTGSRSDPVDLAAAVAHAWHAAIEAYAHDGFAGFQARYARRDALDGQPVRVLDDGRTLYEGIARGVDANGRLRIATAHGLRTVTVGDVSVRPGRATDEWGSAPSAGRAAGKRGGSPSAAGPSQGASAPSGGSAARTAGKRGGPIP